MIIYNSAAYLTTRVLPFKANEGCEANVIISSQRIATLVDQADTTVNKIAVIREELQ